MESGITKQIPYVTKPVSRIFYGTADLPKRKGDPGALLDGILESGINAFDAARVYGKSEKILGKWIADRGIRDRVVILSKGGHPDIFGRKRINRRAIRRDLERSCRELGTDYIDIYLLHRDDPAVEVGEIVEILNELHAEGRIGAFGGSNWTHQRIREANAYAESRNLIPFSVSSPNFGLAQQVQDPWGGGCVTISGPDNEDARAWYAESGMPVIAYSSLGRGLFSGRVKSAEADRASQVMDSFAMKGYGCPENFERLRRCEELAARKDCAVSQIAMAWIYGQSMNTFAVVSTGSTSRMRENIAALSLALTPAELRYLDLKQDSPE